MATSQSGGRRWSARFRPSRSRWRNIARIAAAVPVIVFVLIAAWLVLAPVAIYFAAADE